MIMTSPTWICTSGRPRQGIRGNRLLLGQTSSDPTKATGNTTASAALAISKNPLRTLPRPDSSRLSGGTILPSSITATGRPAASVSTAVLIVARHPLPALIQPADLRNLPTSGMSKYLARTKIRARSERLSSSANPKGTSKKLRWLATTTTGLSNVSSGPSEVWRVRHNRRLTNLKKTALRANRR